MWPSDAEIKVVFATSLKRVRTNETGRAKTLSIIKTTRIINIFFFIILRFTSQLIPTVGVWLVAIVSQLI